MLRIAICDDEETPATGLRALIRDWERQTREPCAIDGFSHGAALLAAMPDGGYDAVFLDIHLGAGMSGMAAAEAIRRLDDGVLIVFVTNYMDYVLQGYEVRAFRYLVKPAARRDVFSCLSGISAARRDRIEKAYLWRSSGAEMRIPFADILYFEVFSHTVEMHVASGQVHAFSQRISDLEKELPPFFVRCHRSLLVNIHHVFAIRKTAVELDTTVELPISQRRRSAVQEAFLRYRV